nr:unnamed protein product [Digitaria exilis]
MAVVAIRRTGGARTWSSLDVDVVEAQAGEALVDAAGDAGGGEVESLVLVAAALGGDDDAVPRDGRVAEAVAEDGLGDRAAVWWRGAGKGRGGVSVRGGVEEVDAEVERAADGGAGCVAGHVPEDVAERGGAEADGADAETRAAKLAELHGWFGGWVDW